MKFHLWLASAFAIFLAANSFSADSTNAPVKTEARSLKDCLQPAPKNGGFAMDGYILWCSSVIKVGDTYHLFASRWPAQYGLGGWTKYPSASARLPQICSALTRFRKSCCKSGRTTGTTRASTM
jgi:hypothetical protein